MSIIRDIVSKYGVNGEEESVNSYGKEVKHKLIELKKLLTDPKKRYNIYICKNENNFM